jgi:4'-phosphopantetheinyl transferase
MMAFPSVAALTNGLLSPAGPNLGTVDVWSCTLEGTPAVQERCHAWLSEDERTRAARFVRPEDQTRFTLAHGGLRAILARYLEVEPATLRFQVGPAGKPELLDHQGRPHVLRFNLSHSYGRMLISVAKEREIGIDLEQIRARLDPLKLARRFYTSMEYQWVNRQPASDRLTAFYRLWVAKEAFLKAQGTGISSLQRCEIVAGKSASRASVRMTDESTMQQGWAIQWLKCGSGWEAAVSAHGHDWVVRVRDAVMV